MAKLVNATDGMTLKDLMSEDGVIIDIRDELDDQIEEPLSYHPNAHLTNDEIIKLLNMEEFMEDEDETPDMGEAMMPWSISFSKIKEKSEKLTSDGKVTKLVRQQGVGEVVASDSLVVVHYGGYFENQDEPFDSSFARGSPDRYRMGKGELIWGLEIGIKTMRKHETAVFVIHPDFAYGELGCVPVIPPSAEVLFIVRIIDIIEGGSAETLENLSAEERKKFTNVRSRATALVKTGAESFKRNKTRQAIREYSRAAAMLEKAHLDNDEEEQEFNRLLSRIYGNLAICFNKEDKPRQACKACLNVPNPTAKTHFHHGRALLKLGEYKRALGELQLSLRMDPGNASTIHEIQLVNDLQRKYLDSEKRLWNNCLKLRSGEQEVNEYARFAREFCSNFANNDAIIRQPLPESLTPKEDKCMREQAAFLGLTVVQQIRYGKEVTYLSKSSHVGPA